ncbi:tyrosine-type recombinase/integrase [Desulfosediminicola sp.]|uniref:tyrosine-type recombinase/integrase n=1 Tax=Desulfosediminicola sp. TaxID=2886825 RepID=UPI003AF30818
MRRNITLNLLKKLEPKSKAFFIRSTTLRGFGIKVNPSGSIKFIAETKRQGVNYRKTLGSFPALSVPEAEKEAIHFLNQVHTGQLQALTKQQYTLAKLFKTYTSKVQLKPSTLKNHTHVVSFYLKDWLDKPVVAITKDMVEKRFYQIRDKGVHGGKPTYSQATKTMRILSALMNYAKADELIDNNPVDVLKLKRVNRSMVKRDVYLNACQAKQLIELTSHEHHPMVLAVQLILHTGLRKNEALKLTWADIQEVNGIPCLFIKDTKNSRPHLIPVTKPISDILRRAENDTEFIFPSPQKQDTHIGDERPTVRRLSKTLGIDFRCHDLRRTFATRASEVGLDFLMVKRLLNHKSNDITAQYIQRDSRENLAVMKQALERVVY